MSAQIAVLAGLLSQLFMTGNSSPTEAATQPTVLSPQVRLEVEYQALYAPAPGPEDICRECYLLECD